MFRNTLLPLVQIKANTGWIAARCMSAAPNPEFFCTIERTNKPYSLTAPQGRQEWHVTHSLLARHHRSRACTRCWFALKNCMCSTIKPIDVPHRLIVYMHNKGNVKLGFD